MLILQRLTPSLVALATIGLLVISSGQQLEASESWQIEEFPLPSVGAGPTDLAMDSQGYLWITEAGTDALARLIPSLATPGTSAGITEYPASPGSWPQHVTIAPDRTVWFSERLGNAVGALLPGATTITEFLLPTPDAQPVGIAVDGDGNIWYSASVAGTIGRFISPTTFLDYPLPTSDSYPQGLVVDAQGNVWAAESAVDQIALLIPSQMTITEFSLPTVGAYPTHLTVDSHGAIWFSENGSDRIGRLIPATGAMVAARGQWASRPGRG